MKILVTGGNGFIGSHLVQGLRTAGHDVVVIDRGSSRTDLDWTGVEYRQGDFSDPGLLAGVLPGCELVYHLASSTVPGTAHLDPSADVRDNLLGSIALVEAMSAAGCGRIVYLSSGGTVYGDCAVDHVDEETPCQPISSYGIVKYAVERFLLSYQRSSGLEPVILRASNPYGARQGKLGLQGLVGTAISRIDSGESLEIWGDGSAVRDYIHVSDLVDLMLKAACPGRTGIFNAGSGQGASVMEVVGLIALALDREPEIDFTPARAFDVARIVLDIERARRVFDWHPKVSLADGIAMTVAAWKAD